MRHSTDQLGALSVVKPSTKSKRVAALEHKRVVRKNSASLGLCVLLLEPGHATDGPRYASQELSFMLTSVFTVNAICRKRQRNPCVSF